MLSAGNAGASFCVGAASIADGRCSLAAAKGRGGDLPTAHLVSQYTIRQTVLCQNIAFARAPSS